jgi:NADPH:quinone reductase-like Zn-dependent oxidoreductase
VEVATLAAMMKAIQVHRFGGPEELVLESVPIPAPESGEVLVQVHAAGINPAETYARIGFANIPEPMRPAPFPLPYRPGSDLSGVVVAAGPEVGSLAVGDEVFGLVRFPAGGVNGGRCYAEFATAPAADLARKPDSIDHISAAGVPMAGLTAYQRLYGQVRIPPGGVVLVNGAAGGVGHFAVQFAKLHRARVIGVASGRHERFMRELGVDEFIDYRRTAAEEVVRDVDVVVDTVGGPDGHRFLKVIRPGGTLTPVYFGDYRPAEAAGLGIAIRGTQVHSDGTQMAGLGALIDQGQVRVGIDSVYPLAEAAKAHTRAEQGHLQGKIVLTVRP